VSEGPHICFAYAGKEDMHNQACAQIDAKCGHSAEISDNANYRMVWHWDGKFHRANYNSYDEAFKAFEGVNADKRAVARMVFHGNHCVLAFVGSMDIRQKLVQFAARNWYLTFHWEGKFQAENFASFDDAIKKFVGFKFERASVLADREGHVWLAYAGKEDLHHQLRHQHLQLVDEAKIKQSDKYHVTWHDGAYKAADFNSYGEAIAHFEKVTGADKAAVARSIVHKGKILAMFCGAALRDGLLNA